MRLCLPGSNPKLVSKSSEEACVQGVRQANWTPPASVSPELCRRLNAIIGLSEILEAEIFSPLGDSNS